MLSRVRKLANHLIDNSEHVTVVKTRAKHIANEMKDFNFVLPTWDFPPFYPQIDDFEEMCLYYLLFNSINYCYFDEYGNKFTDGEYSSSTLTGLCITENWEDLKNFEFLTNVDENYFLGDLFKAKTPISLVKERVAAFREIGNYLRLNPDFSFRKLFTSRRSDAYFVSQYLPTLLPSWSDPFFKRSQLFVGMVHGRFQDKSPFIRGLEHLTVFADYRVPQTLHSMGVIRFSPDLLKQISEGTLIGSGTKPELEIRAASIVGSDLLEKYCNKHHKKTLNALHIDYFLWSAMKGRNSLPQGIIDPIDLPHHRTMTTDY